MHEAEQKYRLCTVCTRPFLKSNSRLRMPGRAGSTISSARFLSPSLTLLWDSLRWLSGTRCKTAKDAVLQLRQSSPCAFGAPLPPSQGGTRVTPAMQRFRKRFRLLANQYFVLRKGLGERSESPSGEARRALLGEGVLSPNNCEPQ